jgi:uncharacterized repeat protein (TIGR03803 family)
LPGPTMADTTQPLHSSSGTLTWRRAIALAVLLATFLAPQSAQAQTEDQLYWFRNGPTDGQLPFAGVIRDPRGNLYGTTGYGGTFNLGTVYKISKHVRTLLHSFNGKTDGATPPSLVQDTAGNLYGTAQAYGPSYCGTVFKLDRRGKLTVLHTFTGPPDGCTPIRLIRDAQGNLYGTTEYGGNFGGACGALGCGTVFKVDTTGKETVLYSFTGGAIGGKDGASPLGGLIRDAAGNLYGTTYGGGPDNFGTVYKLDPAGNETVLHAFTGANIDGEYPQGALAQDSAGNLYGTTQIGGTGNSGTIFKVDPAGNESVLFSFTQQAQGADPQSSLVRDSAGNLYGSTGVSGTYDAGVVFKFDPATGTETVLHNFGKGFDGQAPIGALTLDSAGNIYGATELGGRANAGTVFAIIP